MRRPSLRALVSLLAVGGAAAFVFVQLRPDLLFANTTPAGGDTGAHVWGPAYLRDHLLPRGRLSGWSPDWYAGFPWLTYYFPLPSLLIVLGDVLLPYGVAFKLVTVLGLVSLPVAAWAFGRLSGMAEPGPACLAVATVPFLFASHYTIYGGNIASTLAGEYSFSIALSVALVFLGVLAKGLRTGRHRALAAGLLAATALCHIIVTVFAVVGALVLTLVHLGRRQVAHTAAVGMIGGLLAGFWALPLVVRLPFTNDMGWEKIETYRKELFPHDLRWVLALAGAGVVVAVVRRCRAGLALAGTAAVAGTAFVLAPQGKLWNARLLPFWFLCLYLLAGVAVTSLPAVAAWLVAARPLERLASLVLPVAALAGAITFLAGPLQLKGWWRPAETSARSFVPGWVEWNYSGFESDAKPRRQEYFDLMDTMREVGRAEGCGRALWEYEPELNDMGTPLALMLLPYWTKGCVGSLEGLYFESSATTPYNFLVASELSKNPSRPQRDLPYRAFDLDAGVRHLQLLGVRYYMALSPDVQTAARTNPHLTLVASVGPYPVNYGGRLQERTWEVYRVAGSSLVTPLEHEPVVLAGVGHDEGDWLGPAVRWFQDERRWSVPLAAGGPPRWQRVHRESQALARRPVAPAAVSRIRTDEDRISFDVDRPGSPVLVKTSFFPNWKASGADGPWRVAPNFMVVVPTSRHVELRYGYTGAEYGGWALTLAGLASLVVVARRDRRARGPDEEEDAWDDEAEEGWDPVVVPATGELELVPASAPLAPEGEAEAAQAGHGPQPPQEDGGPGGPGLLDRDGDLGDLEAGPLGSQDELGVEQVAPESARLDDG